MIEAATVSVKTMADNTLRLTIDIDERSAQEAFALFGVRGSPVVIARLTQEAATASARAEQVAGHTSDRVDDEKPRGGDLARLAGQFCRSVEFAEWATGGDCSPRGIEELAQFIRDACGVRSRAEIDHSERAQRLFHESIRKPFAEWCRARGVAA